MCISDAGCACKESNNLDTPPPPPPPHTHTLWTVEHHQLNYLHSLIVGCVCEDQGQIQEFKKGGVQRNFLQKGGGGGGGGGANHILSIENKQNLLKKGGSGPPPPLDLPLKTDMMHCVTEMGVPYMLDKPPRLLKVSVR